MKKIKSYDTYKKKMMKSVKEYHQESEERSYEMLESYFDKVKFNLDTIEDTMDELTIPEFESVKRKIENILEDYNEVYDEFMDIYQEHTLEPSEDMHYLEEKWKNDVDIEKTGEHADKTIEELENELKDLKRKSARYQKEDNPVPKKIKEKESEINFAIRAKRHWK